MFNDLHGFITFFVNYFVYILILDKSWRTVTALGTKASLQCSVTSVLCILVYTAVFCFIFYVFVLSVCPCHASCRFVCSCIYV